jgi:LysM repeat protein
LLTSPLRSSGPDRGDGHLTVDDDLDRPAGAVRRVRIATRQRRVLGGLLALTALAVVVAVTTGTAALWAVAGVTTVLAVTYLGLVHRLRRLAVEREMASAFGRRDAAGWTDLDQGLALTDSSEPVEASVRQGDMVRFVVASALGVVLTPLVMLIKAATGDTSELRRSGLASSILRAHEYGRAQSMRVLTVSVAATAGVTGLGAAFASAASAAPVAAASPLPASASGTTSYTVQAGDTLSAIAQRFGTSYTALAQSNGISNPDQISVGQVIQVPGGGGGATTSYTVQAGDTLSAIAQRFGTSYTALAQSNGISNPDQISVGQVIQVPGGAATTAATTPTAGAGWTGSYTVQSGDTLSGIAAKYGVSYTDLASANGIANPDQISVGQTLKVPATAATTASAAPAPAPAAPAPAPAAPSSQPAFGSAGLAVAQQSSAPAPAAPSSAAQTAVQTAEAQIGKPYEYGGAGPSSFDCSGLVMYAYAAAGISLPHYTVSQYQDTTQISESQLQPGDLVFYGGSAPSHVAMYIGNGQVVSANDTGSLIQNQSITYDGTPTGFTRVAN